MSLISLRDVGKIYVSEGSVAVGIRGVNLDLDIGEFVAVTGKSGSGKTTLLNILSGIDTYEEGQLYIEGEETAHYSQKDWELYRQKYISFVFQEYNIIDSFTVLENIELALMHIDSAKERRKRALELIDRVGLTKFKHHKGSKLSGGQKQRTVIARALAKDSPVILADEPTGNLDAQTSREIIQLLSDISRDKLVVIVTHSFDEVEKFATREIRIFDGAVERDEKLRDTEIKALDHTSCECNNTHVLSKGIRLGAHRFRSMPKLSLFTCLLMVIAMIGSFFATALCISDLDAFDKNYMFTHIDGRSIIIRQDGEPISESELSELQQKLNIDQYIQYDYLLDSSFYIIRYVQEHQMHVAARLRFSFSDKVTVDVGRLPVSDDEAVLVLPISWQMVYGKDELTEDRVSLLGGTVNLKVCGVSYYYDNTREYGCVLMTKEGFERASDAVFFNRSDVRNSVSANIKFMNSLGFAENIQFNIRVDNTLADNEAYITGEYSEYVFPNKDAIKPYEYEIFFKNTKTDSYTNQTTVTPISGVDLTLIQQMDQVSDDAYNSGYSDDYTSDDVIVDKGKYENAIYISSAAAKKIVESAIKDDYTQASLFFDSDIEAQSMTEKLRALGYVSVPSCTTATRESLMISQYLEAVFMILLWAMMIAFLAFFLALCSSRVITSKRADLAILRSMGIENRVVKISMYVQMLISVIPSIVLLAVTAVFIYRSPRLNPAFPFMHAPQYVLMLVGVIVITVLLTRKYNEKMFSQSVRKALKGGQRES